MLGYLWFLSVVIFLILVEFSMLVLVRVLVVLVLVIDFFVFEFFVVIFFWNLDLFLVLGVLEGGLKLI